MTRTLTTDQMTTLVKTVTIFVENRDPFTVGNVINELKRSGDMYDGFHDDSGECVVDDLYDIIEAAVETIMYNLYPEFIPEMRKVYICDRYNTYSNNPKDDYDELEIMEDEYEVDKEGNRIPYCHVDVKDDGDGRTTYSLKPRFEEVDESSEDEDLIPGEYRDQNGEIDWDRDAAESARYEEGDFDNYGNEEFHDSDHPIIYDLKIDKQSRINIKKAVFEEAGWRNDERVVIIGVMDNHSIFYIVRYEDKESEDFYLGDKEFIFGDYELKNGALRIGTTALLDDVNPGDIVKANVVWDETMNYIQVES